MKYICLGYYDEKAWLSLTERERNAFIDECFDYDDELRSKGHFAGGEALNSSGSAVTLRWEGGKASVTDGPYANTKEDLGGILILEAPDLDHAVQLISRHPGLKNGPFEIRPAADLSAMIRESEKRRAKGAAGTEGAPSTAKRPRGAVIQRITPFLWFDDNAEEAANRYVSIFPDSKIVNMTRYSEEASQAAGRPEGSVMTVEFELLGQEFMALNGGPQFTFSPAVSFMVKCETQDEIDAYWEKLADGGEPGQCGWLTDRYGLSWQIVPAALAEILRDPDPGKLRRVMAAVIEMNKLDLERLLAAYEGREAKTGSRKAKSA